MTGATDPAIIHAYRHLYRGLLRAVQHAAPARLVARAQLRSAFRAPGAAWDAAGARRTLWFLQAAGREAGLEHRILKNLLRVRGVRGGARVEWRTRMHESKLKHNAMQDEQRSALRHYEMTIAMLNKTMGLCLR